MSLAREASKRPMHAMGRRGKGTVGKHEDNEYGDVIKGRDWYAVEGYVRGLGGDYGEARP